MHRDLLILQLDQGRAEENHSKLVALDTATGKTVWTINRRAPSSWSTPIVIRTEHREELITCGNPWVVAYKPTSGDELWRAECLGGDVALSPVYSDGRVFVANGMALRAAIRPGGQGHITEFLWSADDVAADVCSPLAAHGLLFLLESEGYLLCYDGKTGRTVWEKDLGKAFTASPSLVGRHIYLLAVDGTMIIIEAAREFREIGRCQLSEECRASPAFLDGRILMRGEKHLFCIAR